MSFTYSYQTTLLSGSRVFDQKLKKVGAIQSVEYYDPVTYYQRLYGSWPNVNTDKITIRFDGEGSDTVYFGESCNDLLLESASAGGAYDKLVLWYRFEETAGTTIGDWMFNVFGEGKPSGGAPTKLQTGVIGTGCLNFNGTDQYLIGGVTNIPSDKMSISFWIKTSDTNATILSFGGYTTHPVERAVKLSSGKINLYETDGASKTSTLLSSNTVNSAAWTHVVCTIGGIASIWKIYVNTTDVSASVVNGPNNTNLPIQKTTVGVTYTNNALSNYLTADIDDLRVYNNVLTQGEIDELYGMKPVFAGTQTSAYSSLVSWYRIEEDSEPTVFIDSKGSNDMTVYNTNYYSLPEDGVDQGLRCFLPTHSSTSAGTHTSDPSFGYAKTATLTNIDVNKFTISFWFKTSTTSYHSTLFCLNPANPTVSMTTINCLYIKNNGGSVRFLQKYRPTSNDPNLLDNAQSIAGEENYHDNDWHHVVCTKSGQTSSDNIKLYIDGSLKITTTLTNSGGNSMAEINNLTLGVSNTYHSNGPWLYWSKDTKTDDFRIYNEELTTTQIAELYATK